MAVQTHGISTVVNHSEVVERGSGTMVSRALRLLAISSTACLMSCATLNKSECETGDWRSIGLKDGSLGKVSDSRLADHSKACGKHGVRLDSEQYLGGYNDGLKSYCTTDVGFETGSDFGKTSYSKSYKGVCPEELELPYLEGYIAGLKMSLDMVSKELADEEAELGNQRGAFLVLKALNSSRADGMEENMEESDRSVSDKKSAVSRIVSEVEKWLTARPELRDQLN